MRIAGKGLIDRTKPIRMTFDGQGIPAFEGDTVASALLANDVRLVGRSFKYHRPRGIFTAGSEEPSALVTTEAGPNQRATMVEARDGLDVHSQNRWPALTHDIGALADFASPLLGAGFYYKSFMWPRRAWERLYEPLIRHAAGLGRLSGKPETAPFEKVWAHCDLLVIGSGPAGLVAALDGARAGLDVILTDEQALMGGRANDEAMEIGGQPADFWVAAVLAELSALPNVRLMPRTTVTGAYDGNSYGALERVAPADEAPREAFWRITAPQAVLASGAHERLLAFPGNDRPGVMLAGAVRSYLHRYGVVPGKAVTVFANNDDAHRTAFDLHAAGVEVAALIDTRPDVEIHAPFPVFTGAEVVDTKGRLGLTEITIRNPSETATLETDCLAISGGWSPAMQISTHLGARPVWSDAHHAFLPPDNGVPGMVVAGAAAGAFSTHAALASGRAAAETMLRAAGKRGRFEPLPQAEDAPLHLEPHARVTPGKRAFVDLANDVTAADVHAAADEGFGAPEHMKRYTTQSMGPDQGKTGNAAALGVLSQASGNPLAEAGPTTARPPYSPVAIAALGAGGRGTGFAPTRVIPSDTAARAAHAEMAEVGLWYRPLFFPEKNETYWRQSCDREVRMVREHVGVSDVSTLGKIDVQGRDAARFLDFIYTGTMSALKTGRIRYGVMLREDGFVLDDGTVTRLGEDHFLLTTTTGAAGQVMDHLSFAAQVLKPDWEVVLTPVTDHWSQFAVTGPRAWDVLASLAGPGLGAVEHMSYAEVEIAHQAARLFRVSFSGEWGYEVAVPARFGESLWHLLVGRAAGFGGGPFGLEAMNVLRIEKGYLTHAEIDGRATADDLGLSAFLSTKKDYIGRVAASRPGLTDAGRAQLVAVKPVGTMKLITSGGLLFSDGEAPMTEHLQGNVTSACYSPTLERTHALAMVTNGRARIGERLFFQDALRGLSGPVEITEACGYDPKGGRLHG